MEERELEDLTKEELLDPGFIPSIFEYYPDEQEREQCLKEIMVVAKGKKITGAIKKAIERCNSDIKVAEMDESLLLMMSVDTTGKPQVTIDNYTKAISNIKEFEGKIRYNEFTGKFERVLNNGKVKNWDDGDDAWVMQIIEETCGIYDPRKFTQGMLLCKDKFAYHPIKDLIEEQPWDGISRIDKFLSGIMNCDDDIYSREVSRMIFYGGIMRLYHPGCKFDYMPILIGEQGTCKSTIVSWLAMDTNSYKEVLTIEGKEGAELLRNAWICEFSELLAMVRSREVESMKAFITREVDSFRPAYGKHVLDIPRHCIFIGTTNNYQFLIDRTGNRRYLPIEINTTKGQLYKNEAMIKKCILACWREAKHLMDTGKIYLTIPNEFESILEEHRMNAFEEDPQEGLVGQYLSDKPVGYKVCVMEIHTQALGNLSKKCTRVDSNAITNYMRSFKNWVHSKSAGRCGDYGMQRYWERIR